MLQNVQQSMEAQDLESKRFDSEVRASDAETKRLTAMSAAMTPEQVQEVVMGTIHGMITSGDLINEMPGRDLGMPDMEPQGMPQ